MNREITQSLIAAASRDAGSLKTVVQGVWDYIRGCEDPEGAFTQFLSEVEPLDIADARRERLRWNAQDFGEHGDAGTLCQRVIANLVRENVTEEAFYHTLWEKLNDGALMTGEASQLAFLARAWMDIRIPYYQLGAGCRMENGDFQTVMQDIYPLLRRAYFILAVPMQQKTQRVSLLMELADRLPTDREKTVFWAAVLNRAEGLTKKRMMAEAGKKGSAE